MFILKYNTSNFDQQLLEVSASVTNHHYGRKAILKDDLGTGYFKALKFPSGISAIITNYVANQDFYEQRKNVIDDAYVLHINLVTAKDEMSVSINNTSASFDNKIYKSVFLTDIKEHYEVKGTKGACFCQLSITIPKKWVLENINQSFTEALLKEYFELKEERLFFDCFDATYRNLFDRVMNTEDNVFYLAITQSIITVIAERFFYRMNTKLIKKLNNNGFFGQAEVA